MAGLKDPATIERMQVRNGNCFKKSIAVLLGAFLVCATTSTALAEPLDTKFLSPKFDESRLVPANPIVSADVDLRLPTALIPVHQLIRIQPFLNEADGYLTSGYTEITFNCLEATSQVIFHAIDLTIPISTIEVVLSTDPTGTSLTVNAADFDDVRQFFIVTLAETLEVGSSYIIKLQFTGYLNDILVGFYRAVYQDENQNDVYLATTKFEPCDARRAFPCFDEPALKATFDIQVLREGTERRTISNMPRIDTYEDTSGNWPGWYWDIFDTTLPMSTYLVAFIVSDFVFISSNKTNVEFRVWAREQAVYQGAYALDVGPDISTFYEDYFSVPFPLPKQDMVALPDFKSGAMENWGLITFRETALLYDPVLSGASNKQRVGAVVAHELAHMWFGDLVSPSWWSYIWLNEGFASYMEYLGLNSVEPTFGMLDQIVVEELQYVFKTDSLETSHPISFEVADPVEIRQMFDTITYSKGSSIIRMMNFFLTESTFRGGLNNYLTTLAYSAATQDDLWSFLTIQGHQDGTLDPGMTVNQIMDTWTLQMGYPVLSVIRSADGTEVTVTQDRYLMVKNENSNDTHNYMWWVPITYTSEDAPDFTDTTTKVWMSDLEKEIVLSGFSAQAAWILFNIQEVGYYRVNYDEPTWIALRDQLLSNYNLIINTNRAQILDDALDLSRAGLLNYTIGLDLTLYLPDEVDYIPWVGTLDNLDYLEQMFTRSAGYGNLKRYLTSLLVPKLYNLVGFEDSLEDPHLTQLLRSLTLSWTCHLDYSSCVSNSVSLYSQWMADPSNVGLVSPNLKSTVYCTAIAEGDVAEWDFAWDQYLNSNLGTDKDYLLYAMGCSRQLWILQRYLDLAFTDGTGIKLQDAYKVFDSVSENDYGRDVAWEYLKLEWDNIAAYYGSYTQLGEFTYTATQEFNTEEKLDELLELRDQHYADLGSATQPVDQAVENVQNNINWMANYYDTINKWLIDNNFGP